MSNRSEGQEKSGRYRASKIMRLAMSGHFRLGTVREQGCVFLVCYGDFTFCSVLFA